MKSRISAAAIAGMLMFTTLSGLAPASAGPNRCTKAETVLARAQQSGKAAAIKRAQTLVAKYCKPKAPAEPAAPTGTVQAFNLNSRIFANPLPLGTYITALNDGYFPLAALEKSHRIQYEPAGVDGSIAITGFSKVAAAYSVPESCTNVTASISSAFKYFLSTAGEVYGGMKLTNGDGATLGSGETNRAVGPFAEGQPGPAGTVTAAIDPSRPSVVVLRIETYSMNAVGLRYTIGLTALCSAVPTGQDKITLTRVSRDGERLLVEARSESLYTDGVWRSTPEGTQAFFNKWPLRVGARGALQAVDSSYSKDLRFSVGTASSQVARW